jgi:hypothetical protein
VTPDYARTYQQAHAWDDWKDFKVSWCEVKLGPGQLITGAVGVHDMTNVYDVPNPETRVSCSAVAHWCKLLLWHCHSDCDNPGDIMLTTP